MKAFPFLGAAMFALASATAANAQTLAKPTPATHVPPIAYKERILKNGLRVLSLPDNSTPNVMVSVWYDVGSNTTPTSARASRICSNIFSAARR